MRSPRFLAALLTVAVLATLPATVRAEGPFGPVGDLIHLATSTGQAPDTVVTQKNPEPPLTATPRAQCGPGSRPEPEIQGRVPAGSATDGLHCNIELVSHQGASGGFKVLRYVDEDGHDCAFYDTALLFPLNALQLAGDSLGVAVLDMSDPANPVQTAQLTELPMLSPHESLNLNAKRGLLAAVLGNPATYPGLVSIYDVSQDCRHPVLQSTTLTARIGHESGFSPDGNTFYAAGTAFESVTAIDVTNPAAPAPVWEGAEISHGMNLSPDGNRAYIADVSTNELLILDVSEIQARKENPQAREVSRLTWDSATIPQNAIPFTKHGHPYILEFDEYATGDEVGAARIIDIGDETQPRVIANLRLEVNNPEGHKAAAGDPGAFSPVQGYAAHYCNIPTPKDPTVVACSFIASGLRVFDISKLRQPREIAYFVAPTKARAENGAMASDFAMSQPAFVPERKEIWYSDGGSGFYAVRVTNNQWPAAATRRCARRSTLRVKLRRGQRVKSVKVRGKRVKARQRGRTVRVRVALPQRRTVRVRLRVKVRAQTKVVKRVRVAHPCR